MLPFDVSQVGRRSLTAVVLGAALLAGSLPSAEGAPQPGSQTGPDTLFPSQGNGGYDVRSYRVTMTYQPALNRIDAKTRIVATAPRALKSFSLDLSGLYVRSVVVDGAKAKFKRHGHELVVTPKHWVRGAFRTVVSYAGKPRAYVDADGSSEGWVKTPDGATALGEPVGAMTWLPSNNTPGDKATYLFRITVPSALKVASNGVLVSHARHGARRTWVWHETDPMSTYLATIAIGKFTLYSSSTTSTTGRTIPIWSLVDPSTGSSASYRTLLPQVISFEEELFGPYPFRSAGMIIDNTSVGYALETQSRPFYPFGTDSYTIVHETAHQWFGDSVTLRDWHDIWLAEGFATYAEWLWEEQQGGNTPAVNFDNLYATGPASPLWHPSPTGFTDSADLFGSPSYNRGAMTLQVLRERVGDVSFFAILKTWAAEHRHGVVRTADFVALAERISGEQLDTLFADWLQLDGKPVGY